ncbi:hypothetical protein [Glutamicibacter protophormiae]
MAFGSAWRRNAPHPQVAQAPWATTSLAACGPIPAQPDVHAYAFT